MQSIFYLKNNIDKAGKFRVEFPEDIYMPLNMGRSILPRRRGKNLDGQTIPYNEGISLKDWINKKILDGVFYLNYKQVYSTEQVQVGSTIYGPNTNLNTIVNAIVTEINSGGSGDSHYTFIQSSPATQWLISHNLNKNPAISVIDSNGDSILPDITYLSSNDVVLTFNVPTSGEAYFN